jgi:hypothetical protein
MKMQVKLLIYFLAVYLSAFNNFAAGMSPPQDKKFSDLQVATFDIDVTPPLGSYVNFASVRQKFVKSWDMGLRAKGIVLLGSGKPIVLLAVDWLAISMECYYTFQQELAKAAGTVPERVAVHALHQHDAPRCDSDDELESKFVCSVIDRLTSAVRQSLENSRTITHIGFGEAEVYKVASNRRILGPEGNTVRAGRMTSCRDSALRAVPEGVIDPIVSLVSFWNENEPVAVLSYYATHPQSYYLTGVPNPDFPGIARFFRQLAVPDALHVHFTGAGGNIGAGKYNDGSKENRLILAERLADGMKRAWESTELRPIFANSVVWNVESVALPANNPQDNVSYYRPKPDSYYNPYLEWHKSGGKIELQCLTLGQVRILHMPAELFVEYQLAAKKMRSDLFIAVAAYGDDGPHYIPTASAFPQGGYEVGAARVTPDAEGILMGAMHKLLNPDH